MGSIRVMGLCPNFLVIPRKVYGLLEQDRHEHFPSKAPSINHSKMPLRVCQVLTANIHCLIYSSLETLRARHYYPIAQIKSWRLKDNNVAICPR